MASFIALPEHLVIQNIDHELDNLSKGFSGVKEKLEVDASALKKIDTCGAQTLITFMRDVDDGVEVVWKSLSVQLKEELVLSGLSKELHIA